MNQNNLERKVRKSGNSYIVGIPPKVLEDLNIKEGSNIEYVKEPTGGYTVKKVNTDEDKDLEILKLVDRTLDRHGDIIRGLADK